MELRYRNSARVGLQSFVTHYAEAFRELFFDSGLWNETNIIEGYRKNAHKIYDDITSVIDTRLEARKVLGRKRLSRDWYEFTFRAGDRLVIVQYSEDSEENVRWVESISIDRKPIIF